MLGLKLKVEDLDTKLWKPMLIQGKGERENRGKDSERE